MKWSRRRKIAVVTAVVVVVAAIVLGSLALSGTFSGPEEQVAPIPGMEPDEGERPVSNIVWPAPLALQIPIDASLADQPADLAVIDGSMYLVDTGHGRLVELSADGKQSKVLDKQIDPQLTMSLPMAITNHEGQLYVADSENGKVLIVSPDGKVSRVVTLAKGAETDTKTPRPIGIVVWNDGSFAVSDANNNRLIKYGPDGTMLWTVGTGSSDSSDTGFNTPSGLALDKDGNVYVVDILNSKVKKYSSDGQFIAKFGQLGDAAGEFSRAKTVAVDDLGNVYVSDGLQRAVQVFDQSGNYLGLVGRKDPNDPKSTSLFNTPHGLKIVDGKLYVVDRYAGVFVFDLPTSQPDTGATTTTSTTESLE
jgi:sugar lactone lactonase YvrE